MTINEIHQSKVLYIIRDEMVADIMSTINIINERLHAPIKITKCGDMIETRSFVNGYEGYRPIIRVETLLQQSQSGRFYPVLRIHDIHHDKMHDVPLKEISLREMMLVLASTNKIFKRRIPTEIQNLIIQNTQVERMNIFDIVTGIVEELFQNYEYGGCIRNTRSSLL